MKLGGIIVALVLAVSAGLSSHAEAACLLGPLAELPITMDGFVPLVSAKVNGVDSRFVFDSGAWWSVLSPAGAVSFGLKVDPYRSISVGGAGGSQRMSPVKIQDFVFHGVTSHQVDFLVGGRPPGGDAVGLLGQNVLGRADVEYDLANGVIRLMGAFDCKDALLAYWVKPGQDWYSIDIDRTYPDRPHIIGSATLNGTRVRVMFDTGDARSILSLEAAARAGVRPQDPGVTPAGFTVGIAANSKVTTWVAPFASFKLGDEEIKNTKLRIGDVRANNGGALDQVDLVLGADFFLSHRIYVAKSQHKLYFTYNGGPVFRLDDGRAPADSRTTNVTATSDPYADVPTDAAGFSRRGAAFMARRDYDHALSDLNRAVEMAPASPDYLFERGTLYLRLDRKAAARADFDRSVQLDPDFGKGWAAEIEMDIAAKEMLRARHDLIAADHAASLTPDARLFLASGYERIKDPATAIVQYDLWVAARANDPRMAAVLYGRCRVRALWGLDPPLALADCDAALKLHPHDPAVLGMRGLVYLRMGDYDHALSDYNDALRLDRTAAAKGEPDSAWNLYGRGLAHLRKGEKAEGDADLQAVAARWPHFAEEAKGYGVAP